jgi:tRNA pseudouridine55 synthase
MNKVKQVVGLTGSPQLNQVLLIDKEAGWTSFDVVAKIRGAANKLAADQGVAKTKHGVKVGHAGTLDPFATGLLIVLVGKENTAKQDTFMKQDKEYEATLCLGATSTTGDPEGKVAISSSEFRIPNEFRIDEVLKQFLGEIEQIPPIYSAIKIDGERAYKLARRGEAPEMKSRKVTIHSLKIENFEYPTLKIVVECSSGTYIRTLAEDIGKALGCGAYLTALRRTKIGTLSVVDANSVEDAVREIAAT